MTSQPAPTESSARPVALVTGASAGIGRSFAELLAHRRHDLILAARRVERLEEVAQAIRARGLRAEVIAADLGDPTTAARLIDESLNRYGRIDVLVNNAGYGFAQRFCELSWEEHRRFLEVMLTSTVELTHRVLPAMRERRAGRIINVASLAAFAPEPAGSLYSATKRFMVSFTRALALELDGSGVTATAVCPGFTYSEFHDVMGNRAHMNSLPKWLWMEGAHPTPSPASDSTHFCGHMAGHPVVITGTVNRLIAGLCAVLPMHLLQRLAPHRRGSWIATTTRAEETRCARIHARCCEPEEAR
jgi:uncharacterized protein